MVYLIDIHGTTKALYSEPIYQGSVGVNEIVLLAPFPANTQIIVNAILPNGLRLKNLEPMGATTLVNGVEQLFDRNGNGYSTFKCTIDKSLTSIAGTVQIQFKVIHGIGRTTATYTTSFTVSEGIVDTDEIEIPTDTDYLNAVLQYLAEINSDPVESVLYSAPSKDVISISEVSSVEPNSDNDGFETSDGGTLKDNLFQFADNKQGFLMRWTGFKENRITITFEDDIDIGILQLYMVTSNATNIIWRYATYDSDGQPVVGASNQTISKTNGIININPRANISRTVKSLVLYFQGSNVLVYGIKLFKRTMQGEYIFTFKSGATAIIEACDGELVQQYAREVEAAATQVEADKEYVSNSIASLNKNKPGGVAGLGSDGKLLPSVIPPIVKTDYLTISSEEELTMLSTAQTGDIAIVVEGNRVISSWILLGVHYYDRSNWFLESPATVGSAAYAAQAGEANNAIRVGGVAIEGIYTESEYASLGAKTDDTVYIVEV